MSFRRFGHIEALEDRRVLAPLIEVGEHLLAPNTPSQVIPLYVSGEAEVQGLNLNVQVAGGGPGAGGLIAGPAIEALDILTGTIFAENNTGVWDHDGQGADDLFAQFEGHATTTASGTVVTTGRLATVTIDTTGFFWGVWELRLSDTLNGDTDFAGVDAAITNGTLLIDIPPVANPGGPYSVPLGQAIVLDASGSSDPDPDDAIVEYLWDLDGDLLFGEHGPAAAQGDERGPNPTFTPTGLAPGTWLVALRVRDSLGQVSQSATHIEITVPPDPVLPTIWIEDAEVLEGDGQAVYLRFGVELSEISTLPITVDYATSDGTALAGSDYEAVGGQIYFAPGEQVAWVDVPVLGDLLDESDEVLFVILDNPENAVLGRRLATGTIRDDDPEPVLSVSDAQVQEGGATAALLTVTLSAPSGRVVTVHYSTVDGTARAGQDYQAFSGQIGFLPGQVEQPITVPLLDDHQAEFDEHFFLVLSDPEHATIGDGQGQVLITDDDEPAYLVRLALVVPSKRPMPEEALTTLQYAAVQMQAWYADQMDRWGFGPKTFQYETEADGVTPRVHVIPTEQTDAWLRADPWERVPAVLADAGLPVWAPGEIWLAVYVGLDMDPDGALVGDFSQGQSPGFASAPGLVVQAWHPLLSPTYLADPTPYHGQIVPELGPYPMQFGVTAPQEQGETFSSVSSSRLGMMLHELSHALGLKHDARNDAPFCGDIMGDGQRGFRGWAYPDTFPDNDVRLSNAAALVLQHSRYFNPDGVWTDSDAPTLSVLVSGTVEPLEGMLDIPFLASDEGGLAVALLLRNGLVIGELALWGATLAEEAFFTPYYLPGELNEFTICVYDTQGNRQDQTFSLTPSSGSNQAPQPWLIVGNSQVRPGAPVVLDASGSLDPDGEPGTLLFAWDLDGDGAVDTEPSPEPSIQTVYNEAGVRWVSVWVTDAQDVLAVSAPLALRVAEAPALWIDDSAASEGHEGSQDIAFTVWLSEPAVQIVLVEYQTFDATATAGQDYEARTDTLVFLPGQTVRTVTVPILGDVLVEDNETFGVRLVDPANAVLGRAEAEGLILDDDVHSALGPVDYRLLPGLDFSAGPLWYELQTVRAGLLTLEAIPTDTPEHLSITLFDAAGMVVAESSPAFGRQRIDQPVEGGQT